MPDHWESLARNGSAYRNLFLMMTDAWHFSGAPRNLGVNCGGDTNSRSFGQRNMRSEREAVNLPEPKVSLKVACFYNQAVAIGHMKVVCQRLSTS